MGWRTIGYHCVTRFLKSASFAAGFFNTRIITLLYQINFARKHKISHSRKLLVSMYSRQLSFTVQSLFDKKVANNKVVSSAFIWKFRLCVPLPFIKFISLSLQRNSVALAPETTATCRSAYIQREASAAVKFGCKTYLMASTSRITWTLPIRKTDLCEIQIWAVLSVLSL